MSSISSAVSAAGLTARKRVWSGTRPITGFLLLVLLVAWCTARAEGPEDEYLQIFNLIQLADDLDTSGKAAPAKAKYQEAYTALRSFQKNHRDWEAKMVSSRLTYLAEKLAGPAEPPPADTAAATATNAPAAQTGAKPARPASTSPVKLLTAGAEPRKALRLHPKPGDKQALTLTMRLAVQTKARETATSTTKLPPMTIPLTVTANAVSDKGDITYEAVMGEIGVVAEPGAPPQMIEEIKSGLSGLKGVSCTDTISSHGLSTGGEFKAPAGTDPQVRQFMDQVKATFAQVSAPLPEEAVGPGAKWEVKRPVKSQGLTIEQTATYELVSLEGERLTTKSVIAQRAANQKVENPAMPGMKVDLTKLVSNSTGEFTHDLAMLMPATGTGKVHTETSMALNLGGKKQAMAMTIDVDLRLEAK